MLTLTSATRAESPEDVDGAVAEGAVAVRALAPERGFVTGGLRVAVHGAGFTDALACQFGPRVVAPVSINEQGTEMLCVAPPFANHAGGFVRVGVAIRGGGGAGAAASPPRGALTFAYEVTPRPTSVAPRSIDASGGEVVWITGGDLHVADACAFEPRPARIVAKRFVSSALGACETPARTPGEGAVALVASDENWRGHGVLNDVWNDGGVAGLAVVAYRPEDKEILRDGAETASAALAARRTAEFRAAAVSADETSPANAPVPVAVSAVPWEGPAVGGSPVFVAGVDLASTPAFCLFRFGVAAAEAEAGEGEKKASSGRPAFAVPGAVVSSALIACERPPAPAWAGALAAHVEAGSPALGWSTAGTAAVSPRGGAAATRVAPRTLPAEGGADVSVFFQSVSRSRVSVGASASCRFGTIGPVAGLAIDAEEMRCVSPASAPRRGVRVYGPDPEASGSFFGTGAGTTVRVVEDASARDARSDDARSDDARRSDASSDETALLGLLGIPDSPTRVAAVAALARLDALASAVAAGAAVARLRSPAFVPAEFGGAVALEGVFPAASGAYLEAFGTQITCRFGSVAVLGRRIDGARAECAAPSAAPGAKRVAVDGAAGAVALEQRLTLVRSPASTSYAKRDDVAETKDVVPRRASFETHEVRLAHYAGGSDVFAGTRDFVRFELSLNSAAGAFASSSVATRCVFDDGASTRARFVSSVSGTCDVPIRAIARRSRDVARASAVSRTSAGASVVVTRFALARGDPDGKDQQTHLSESFATRRASFALRLEPPVVTGAVPSVVDAEGGTPVTVFGRGLFDSTAGAPGEESARVAPSSAWCRFGSLGPVSGRREEEDDGFAGALACVSPARAPSRAHSRSHGENPRGTILVTAFDAFWSSAARVAARRRPTSAFAAPSAVVRDAGRGDGFSKVTVHFAGFRRTRLVAIRASSSGPAFDTLELSASASESGFAIAFALAFAESPAVANAAPSAVSADGGTVARLTGPPGSKTPHAFSFSFGGGGELPGTTLPGGTTPFLCVFLDDGDSSGALNAATTATVVFSSALAACESPPARGADRSDALGGRVDAVGGGAASLGKSAHDSVRGAPFARVTPVSVTAVSPVTADWLASPTVTLALRRAGAASQLADRSSCWIGAVGPIRARRISTSEVACVAPAHAGARLAPVRLLPDLSAPAAPSAAPVAVAFTVSADGMDARGRPGGSALGGGAAPAPPNTLNPEKRDGVVRAATPRVSFGGAPAVLHGARFGNIGENLEHAPYWCVFEDASTRRVYASRATRVSGAMARCAFVGADAFPRAALGDGGGVFATTVALGFEPRRYAGAAHHESRHAPTVVSVTPRVVPAAGGVEIALVGTAFAGSRLPDETLDASQSSLRALRFGCRFGSVGPVAARGVSSSSATCVSPAFAPSAQVTGFATGRALAARAVPVGFALDPETHLAETTWGGDDDVAARKKDVSATVLVDGASESGVSPVALGAFGTVAGGVSFDVLDVALSVAVAAHGGLGGFASEETPLLRCVFGGDSQNRELSSSSRRVSRQTRRATCVSPPRLARVGLGFEALRVFAESRGAFVAGSRGAAAPLQFAFAPVPLAAGVFPRRGWGPEVAHVFGAHLASSADGASGGGSIAGPFADNDACVFGGVAVPAKVVSSALVACETLSQGAESPTRTHTRTTASFVDPGDAFAGAVGPSAVSVYERASHFLQTKTRDSSDVATSYEADASADAAPSLWFVTVPEARPTHVDVEGGWSDGGTLARVTTSLTHHAGGAPGWLDCAFGSTLVPGRPASASFSADGFEFGPPPGANSNQRRAAESAHLECVSPAHVPGTVPLELVPAKSKVPSAESAVFFSFA